MKNISIYVFLLFLLPSAIWAQQGGKYLAGRVTAQTQEEDGPLPGANIFWLGTNIGSVSDADGFFSIRKPENERKLVVAFVGYQNDTIDAWGEEYLEVSLNASVDLDEVNVNYRKKSTEISYLDPMKTEKIGEDELTKAACCNLSESFETIPSVDVTFTDAVTGTRQIQMLGLASPYIQITRESMPEVRGLAANFGLTYTPGHWVEGIQLNKGTGSVVNGFESIAGQINIELRKPEDADRFYVNGYLNEGGRLEANANLAHRFKNEKWSTALLLHASQNPIKWDRNEDGFLDNPLSENYIGVNRWKYFGSNGFRMQFGVKGTLIDNMAGEMDFNPSTDELTTNHWGMQMNTKRVEGWAKFGKVFEEMPWKSTGIQVSAVNHEMDSYFGLREYDASQRSVYANYMYQSIFSNTDHKFRTGASLQYDDYRESFVGNDFDRTEIVPGAYFEYSYCYFETFNLVAGIRADHHNLYGPFVTPRLHVRYAIDDKTVLRGSAGRGQRSANILAENMGLLASSREFVIQGDDSDKPYGINPEVAWNYGGSITRNFKWANRNGSFSVDVFRSDFQNQIVTDLDQDPQKAVFYNLEGKSYSNSIQLQLDYELIERLDLRLAYRWFDVHTTYNGEILQKPLVSTHRAFLNLSYETKNQWKFDYTINWQGSKRIPFTGSNPEAFQLAERSPGFVLMNAQVNKLWKDKFEIYIGGENLLNFRQDDPILSSSDPFSPYFDSSLIWGPVFGRNVYVGVRWRLK